MEHYGKGWNMPPPHSEAEFAVFRRAGDPPPPTPAAKSEDARMPSENNWMSGVSGMREMSKGRDDMIDTSCDIKGQTERRLGSGEPN